MQPKGGLGAIARSGPGLPFFFELFFLGRAEPRRGTQRFAIIVERQVADVERKRARWRLLVDDNRNRAAFDALAEGDAAAAGKPCVREPLEHWRDHITSPDHRYNSDLISRSKVSFVAMPWCLRQILPSRPMRIVVGSPQIGPNASWT